MKYHSKYVFQEMKGCVKIGKNSARIAILKFRERVACKQHNNSGENRKNANDEYTKNNFVGTTKQYASLKNASIPKLNQYVFIF